MVQEIQTGWGWGARNVSQTLPAAERGITNILFALRDRESVLVRQKLWAVRVLPFQLIPSTRMNKILRLSMEE